MHLAEQVPHVWRAWLSSVGRRVSSRPGPYGSPHHSLTCPPQRVLGISQSEHKCCWSRAPLDLRVHFSWRHGQESGAAGKAFVPLSQGCQKASGLSQLLCARFSVAYDLEHLHVSWLLSSPP